MAFLITAGLVIDSWAAARQLAPEAEGANTQRRSKERRLQRYYERHEQRWIERAKRRQRLDAASRSSDIFSSFSELDRQVRRVAERGREWDRMIEASTRAARAAAEEQSRLVNRHMAFAEMASQLLRPVQINVASPLAKYALMSQPKNRSAN